MSRCVGLSDAGRKAASGDPEALARAHEDVKRLRAAYEAALAEVADRATR